MIGVEGNVVWPIDYIQTTLNSTILQTGKRCKCQKRIDFDIQCEHELAVVPKFNHMHYNERWLNNTAFNMMKPSLAPQCKPNGVPTQTCDFTNDTTDIEIDFDGYDSSKVSYNDLVLRCTELCRTVANDQKNVVP